MSQAARQKFIRRWHRRLGPIIGIQLLAWSLGGLYFSWVHITLVRGETDIDAAEPPDLKFENYLAPLPPLIRNSELAGVEHIELGKLLNLPVYRLTQDDHHAETYNAITGERISPIARETAVAVAEADFAPQVPVKGATLLENQGGEYRGPVPVWKVEFSNWKATAIYVSAETGKVTARRSSIWRAYDILWMFHIMDYGARENFNNWILRSMSILGVTTIVSGYYLWYLTTPLLGPTRRAQSRSPRRRRTRKR